MGAISFIVKTNGDPFGFRLIGRVLRLWDEADRHIEEVIALASDYASACGTYEEAVKRRPGKLVTLRQQARVIRKSR